MTHIRRRTPSSSDKQQEAAWIAGIQAGDESAFVALFRMYYPGLHRFALRYVRDPEAADDIVQDVLFRVWEHRQHWAVRTSAKTYLYSAVRNTALDRLRHAQVEQQWRAQVTAAAAELGGGADPADTIAAVELAELDQAVARAIETLPARCRQVFLLSRENGLSHAEIAEVMKISPKTVQLHMWRALKTLRVAVRPFLALALLLR